MPINILMPALSPTMEKGNLSKWLKKEGDAVKTGDVIAEIETDKATMEYEAVDDGVMAKIVVPEGTNDVAVNQLIAVMAQEGEDVKAAAAGAGQGATSTARAPSTPPSPPRGEGAAQQAAAPSTSPQAAKEAKSPPPPQAPRAPSPQRGEGGGEGVRTNGHGAGAGANRIFSSPLARRLAKDANIELGRIQGTGPHGRVIARDVEAARSGQGLRAPAAAPAGAPLIAPSMSDQQIRALYDDGSYEFVPHDGMRRTIAQRLIASVQTIPHFYLTIDCDIGKLLEAREEINTAAPKDKDGKPAYKLSVNDFVIKALALALQRVPEANVSWTDAGMLKHKHSDVGVAVAMPNGLITPIIRNAETKSLSAISNEMKELAARGRARKLKPQEYQGGTTSISNLGMYGIKDFTAVINPPQSTILAVGTGEERAVVRGGKIEAAHIMSVTMSCDHRAVDGALGAMLIGAFKALIENPVMMLV
ncbi:MAG: pyruvate dehydrogenase complex dihydrolipoamide acetyltransferase [Xanthobacteraceae bacterium]|jgi:pyruvate dehydrogenase E2 component (dihydrolipoamide acetyltransferase)